MTKPRVEIIGNTVRRPRYPWTPTVHRVLAHLRAAGLTSVPAPLALDDDHETVSLLQGLAGPACWPHQATEVGLRSAARLLRTVHDATVGWTPPVDADWGRPPSVPAEVICHGDPGPWNMTWTDGEATDSSTGTTVIRGRGGRTSPTPWSTWRPFATTPKPCAGWGSTSRPTGPGGSKSSVRRTASSPRGWPMR